MCRCGLDDGQLISSKACSHYVVVKVTFENTQGGQLEEVRAEFQQGTLKQCADPTLFACERVHL